MFDDQVEQRFDRAFAGGGIVRGEARPAAGVDVRNLERVLRPEFLEEVQRFHQHVVRPGVGAVDLVDDDDRLEANFQGLGHHEAGLRAGAFEGVDQHQGAVGHPQHALDLAAEVGVAGGVDDVDLRSLVVEGDVLRENRDSAFALEVVGVKDAVALELGVAELSALLEEGVDEGGLPVVDVGDDGNIADVVTSHGLLLSRRSDGGPPSGAGPQRPIS